MKLYISSTIKCIGETEFKLWILMFLKYSALLMGTTGGTSTNMKFIFSPGIS